MVRVCKKCKQQKEENEFSIELVQFKYTCKECNKKPQNYVCRISPFTPIDGEVWKSVIGYEGLYEVSDLGRVKNLRRKRIDKVWHNETLMKPKNSTEIYPRVELSKNSVRKIISVHRLMALAFMPNPENKPNINHKNGKRDDNRLENLEWCTQKENIQHAWDTGLCTYHNGHYRKPIMAIDTRNNSAISFQTVKAAGEYLGMSSSSMGEHILGRVKKYKYKFEYIYQ